MSDWREHIQEAIRLAEFQVAAMAQSPAQAALYLHAIGLFKDHLTWHPANHSCQYLAGVVAMLRRQDPGDDTDLYLASRHTLGLVDDGAEWESRLETARQGLKDAGVTV